MQGRFMYNEYLFCCLSEEEINELQKAMSEERYKVIYELQHNLAPEKKGIRCKKCGAFYPYRQLKYNEKIYDSDEYKKLPGVTYKYKKAAIFLRGNHYYARNKNNLLRFEIQDNKEILKSEIKIMGETLYYAISDDERYIATASTKGSLAIQLLATGEVIARKRNTKTSGEFLFGQNTDHLIYFCDGFLYQWNFIKNECVQLLDCSAIFACDEDAFESKNSNVLSETETTSLEPENSSSETAPASLESENSLSETAPTSLESESISLEIEAASSKTKKHSLKKETQNIPEICDNIKNDKIIVCKSLIYNINTEKYVLELWMDGRTIVAESNLQTIEKKLEFAGGSANSNILYEHNSKIYSIPCKDDGMICNEQFAEVERFDYPCLLKYINPAGWAPISYFENSNPDHIYVSPDGKWLLLDYFVSIVLLRRKDDKVVAFLADDKGKTFGSMGFVDADTIWYSWGDTTYIQKM